MGGMTEWFVDSELLLIFFPLCCNDNTFGLKLVHREFVSMYSMLLYDCKSETTGDKIFFCECHSFCIILLSCIRLTCLSGGLAIKC